jgi:hypothetical protein
MSSTQFPIVGEIWLNLQTILSTNAKRLVDDIARKQGVDSKELWANIKPQIRIGLLDIEVPEDAPQFCSHLKGYSEHGAVRMRCRAPCILGFTSCAEHAGKPDSSISVEMPTVKRIFDIGNKAYFVDVHGIARDRNGIPKGTVSSDGTLLLFETWARPPSSASNGKV